MNAPETRPWVWFLQLAGMGVGMGVGISLGRDLGDWWLTRALLAGGIGGAVTLGWVGLVWLLVLRGRPPSQ